MTAALARICAGRVHYAWVALIVAFTITLGAVGVRAAPGVIIVPLQQAFGWSVGTISAAISLNILLLGMTGPFITGLMETLGLRRTVLLCLSLLLLGTGLSTFITAQWQLFATCLDKQRLQCFVELRVAMPRVCCCVVSYGAHVEEAEARKVVVREQLLCTNCRSTCRNCTTPMRLR